MVESGSQQFFLSYVECLRHCYERKWGEVLHRPKRTHLMIAEEYCGNTIDRVNTIYLAITDNLTSKRFKCLDRCPDWNAINVVHTILFPTCSVVIAFNRSCTNLRIFKIPSETPM